MCRLQERGLVAPLTSRRDDAKRWRWGVVGGTAAAAVAADQLSKWWALENLADGPIDLVGSLRLNLVFNAGGAFSVGSGATGMFIVLGIALLVGLIWWSRYATSPLAAAGLGLIIGGASGNLTDRLLRSHDGRVVDFIDLQWWPVFNVADVVLFVGAGLLALATWRDGSAGASLSEDQ